MNKSVIVEWKDSQPQGHVEVYHGESVELAVISGYGNAGGGRFSFSSTGRCRLEITIGRANMKAGANATIVTVMTEKTPFTFFLRDVCREQPVFMPAFGIVVTEVGDERPYEQIEKEIASRSLVSDLARWETEPEESYESTSQVTKDIAADTVLGISRDMRLFVVTLKGRNGKQLDWIDPHYMWQTVPLPEAGGRPVKYGFAFGLGLGCCNVARRHLEEGSYPILRAELVEGYISYNVTAFATLEKQPLAPANVRGTHCMVASQHGACNSLTDDQAAEYARLLDGEVETGEETILYFRVEAVNTARVPQYAWFNVPEPNRHEDPTNFATGISFTFDGQTGFSLYSPDRIFCLSKLNGLPMPDDELAMLVKPGEAAVFEFMIPHRPISAARAETLMEAQFTKKHEECRQFWQNKLDAAADFNVPETRIREMLKAGLLHLDLVTCGLEPDGSLSPAAGLDYAPIGSESAPMVLFYDSVGLHDIARRSIMYFLDRQRESGEIRVYGEYMLETGAVLWFACEHYRYTKDDKWLAAISPVLIKACRYLNNWSTENQLDKYSGTGYGMLDGKCADMKDNYHTFMLNGYAYLGMSRTAEVLAQLAPAESKEIGTQAQQLKAYIRAAFFDNMAHSPVVPLQDGSWCATVAPWTEYKGPVCLFADGGKWYTHSAVTVRDSLTGPLWLVFQEVVSPGEQAAGFMLSMFCEMMHLNNVAIGQPYYSRHPWIHLKRREPGAFLKAYYSTMSVMADRETYTFHEDSYPASFHKTHEEAWFLMESRWMLYFEDGDTLRLLLGIPRKWLDNGKTIQIRDAASYFGHFSLFVESCLEQNIIVAKIVCDPERKPKQFELRLPHPKGRKAQIARGGRYNAAAESVMIDCIDGSCEVTLIFE